MPKAKTNDALTGIPPVVQYQLSLRIATANRKVPRTMAQFPTCRGRLENAAELRCAPLAMRQYSYAAEATIHSRLSWNGRLAIPYGLNHLPGTKP